MSMPTPNLEFPLDVPHQGPEVDLPLGPPATRPLGLGGGGDRNRNELERSLLKAAISVLPFFNPNLMGFSPLWPLKAVEVTLSSSLVLSPLRDPLTKTGRGREAGPSFDRSCSQTAMF